MTDRDPKLAAIDRFFVAYAAHDGDGIASVLARDIAWTIPGTTLSRAPSTVLMKC